MRNKAAALAMMAHGLSAAMYTMDAGTQTNPIYFPKKHTKQSYRSQQRAAKKRRKQR